MIKTTDIISNLQAAKGVLILPVHLDLFSLAFATAIIKEALITIKSGKLRELFRFLGKNYD